MATCHLCEKRPARRACPATATRICSVCCGTLREVEIDCPSDCVHLQASRTWESPRTAARSPRRLRFSTQFVHRYAGPLAVLSERIVSERTRWPGMVDPDVRAAFEALAATLRTLDSGIYYETHPAGNAAAEAVYGSLKSAFDELMAPGSDREALKVSEAREILEFLLSTCEFHSGERPRSRRYLDWLTEMAPGAAGDDEGAGRLILP